jgi:hypothetical protein
MDLLQLESSWWWFVTVLALLELAALVLWFYAQKLRRRRSQPDAGETPQDVGSHRDPKWMSREIQRLCSGHTPSEPLIKNMSAEDRVMFEVSVIEALNSGTRESQNRLRAALINYGYDELCARRVMIEDLSDKVRATALLTLLRPDWRDDRADVDQRPAQRDSSRELSKGRGV